MAEGTADITVDEGGDLHLHCAKSFNPSDMRPAPADSPSDRLLVSSSVLRLASPVFKAMLRKDFSESRERADGKKHVAVPFTAAMLGPLMRKLHYLPTGTAAGGGLSPAALEEMLVFLDMYDMQPVSLRINQSVHHHVARGYEGSLVGGLDMSAEVRELMEDLAGEEAALEAMQWVTVASAMQNADILNKAAKVLVYTARESQGRLGYGGRFIADVVPERIVDGVVEKRDSLLLCIHEIIDGHAELLANLPATECHCLIDEPEGATCKTPPGRVSAAHPCHNSLTNPRCLDEGLAKLYRIKTSYRSSTSKADQGSLVDMWNALNKLRCLNRTSDGGWKGMNMEHMYCDAVSKVRYSVGRRLLEFALRDWKCVEFEDRNPRKRYNPSFV